MRVRKNGHNAGFLCIDFVDIARHVQAPLPYWLIRSPNPSEIQCLTWSVVHNNHLSVSIGTCMGIIGGLDSYDRLQRAMILEHSQFVLADHKEKAEKTGVTQRRYNNYIESKKKNQVISHESDISYLFGYWSCTLTLNGRHGSLMKNHSSVKVPLFSVSNSMDWMTWLVFSDKPSSMRKLSGVADRSLVPL